MDGGRKIVSHEGGLIAVPVVQECEMAIAELYFSVSERWVMGHE